MKDITLCAIDLAKSVFQVECRNHAGRTMLRKQVSRSKFVEFIAQLPAGCLVAMEACAGSHDWGRKFVKLGLRVKLLPPEAVARMRGGQKDDKNDATAIAEAASNTKIRPVSLKTEEQQRVVSLHRTRELLMQQRTALSNHLRGLLAERGIVISEGVSSLRKKFYSVLEEHRQELGELAYQHFCALFDYVKDLDKQVNDYQKRIRAEGKDKKSVRQLSELPAVGIHTATYAEAMYGECAQFKNGRDFSANIGLVPRHYGTGGKVRLGPITKRGDSYLRKTLIHGARSVVRYAEGKTDQLSLWLNKLKSSKGTNVAAVALANKVARMIWVVLAKGVDYDPQLASQAV